MPLGRVALLALLICVALSAPHVLLAAPDAEAPPGIAPTSVTLKTVLDSHLKAVGKPSSPIQTEIETGTVNEYGLTGTYKTVTDRENWRSTETLGGFTTQSGRYKGERWEQNENGLTTLLHGLHQRNQVSGAALERSELGIDDPSVKLLGTVSQPVNAYVVEINPSSGRHEFLFIDASTYLLDRQESIYTTGRQVATYSDYHRLDGFMEAWHRHYSDGHPQNEADYVTTADDVNVPVSASDVEMAGIARELLEYPAGATTIKVPVRIVDGAVIVRVMINGRGLDFMLDSGASEIVIDHEVSKALGLHTFGKSVATVAGPFEQSKAVIPDLAIGPLHMRNIVVSSLPFTQDVEQGTKVVGLLGFDFISDNVVKVDYDHQVIELTPGDAFVAPPDASYVDANLDAGVPMVPASVNGALGSHFVIDTGATGGMVIFSGFAAAHPTQVTDMGEGKIINRYLYGITASGVGGQIPMSAIQIKEFEFGPVHFEGFLGMLTRAKSTFELEDTDGLIGYDILRSFDIYFDYLHSRVYLAPNDFLKRTGTKMSH